MLPPFMLFVYPSNLWSILVYSGIYRDKNSYSFSANWNLAGKVSDIIVRFMAQWNSGACEPELP